VADVRVERLAAVLVDYSIAVQPGDLVVVEGSLLAAPLIRALHRRILEAGAFPHVKAGANGTAETLLSRGTNAQLDWVNPSRYEQYERCDATIYIDAPANTRALSGVDPERQARAGRASGPLRDLAMSKAAAGKLRWSVTVLPTQAAAQDAQMSLAEYEDFVYGAGRLADDDPVAAWKAFGKTLHGLRDWLSTTREIRIVADGTDLRVGVAGRTWIPCEGRENFPDGEIFTGPVETSLEGEISFTFPAVRGGRSVEGVRLVFREGEVVEASARKGEDYLHEMLAMDAGARRVGEFAFGLNESIREFTRSILFDEKIGGTVHLALGKSYPESGGLNQSALHWDIVCDLRQRSEVYADGELVYRDGRFLNGVF
jgi:aminopeptidase